MSYLKNDTSLVIHLHLNLVEFTEYLLVFLMVFWFALSFLKHPFSLQEFRSCFCCDVTFCIHILKLKHIKWHTLRFWIIYIFRHEHVYHIWYFDWSVRMLNIIPAWNSHYMLKQENENKVYICSQPVICYNTGHEYKWGRTILLRIRKWI
jgi:hypothetical protein